MEHKWKRLMGYYRPYLGLFLSDMFFAILGAGVTLAIPLIVRYITGTVILMEQGRMMTEVLKLSAVMVALVLVACIRSCPFHFMMTRRWDSCFPGSPAISLRSRSFFITDRRIS